MKKYHISSREYFSLHHDRFVQILSRSYLLHKSDFFVFRDKDATKKQKKRILRAINRVKPHMKTRFLISSEPKLARKYGVGVHLNSLQMRELRRARSKIGFVVISTHSPQEARLAVRLGASLATLSPIFYSPNKARPLGVDIFKELNAKIRSRLIALGGVVGEEQIFALKDVGVFAFASIRYFVGNKWILKQ